MVSGRAFFLAMVLAVGYFAAGAQSWQSLNGPIRPHEVADIVIGGSSLFAAFLPRADLLYLTRAEQSPKGERSSPPYEKILERWFRITSTEQHTGCRVEDYGRVS